MKELIEYNEKRVPILLDHTVNQQERNNINSLLKILIYSYWQNHPSGEENEEIFNEFEKRSRDNGDKKILIRDLIINNEKKNLIFCYDVIEHINKIYNGQTNIRINVEFYDLSYERIN